MHWVAYRPGSVTCPPAKRGCSDSPNISFGVPWSSQTGAHESTLAVPFTHNRSEEEVMSAFKYNRLDKNNAAVLLVDHQSGLISLVRDFRPRVQEQCAGRSRTAPNTSSCHHSHDQLRRRPQRAAGPGAERDVPRRALHRPPRQHQRVGQRGFRQGDQATGRKKLIIAGVVTKVCVAFPALSALAEGFDVFVVTDARAPSTRPVGRRGRAWKPPARR